MKPDLAGAYNNRGNVYKDKGSLTVLLKTIIAIELEQDYEEAYNNRGIAYKDKGEFDRAIEDYNTAIEENRIMKKRIQSWHCL